MPLPLPLVASGRGGASASGGAKFVTLANRLGVGRETLRRTLDALVEAELVARNPGYGHPLRPEYVLTARGRRLGPAAARLVEALRDEGLEDLGLKKWSTPGRHRARGANGGSPSSEPRSASHRGR